VAAEFGQVAAARLLLARGADVNAPSRIDADGVGGQTAIFHAVTQYADGGLAVAQLLLEHGADLTVRTRLPGDYERPDEFVDATPLGYALRFPEGQRERATVTLLRERGAS
jgi:ankyrin repeat protein